MITHLNPHKEPIIKEINNNVSKNDNKENEASNIYHFEAFSNKSKNKDIDGKNKDSIESNNKTSNQNRKVLSDKNM